ncbi:hypothetical protein STENM223S_02264 [Streptomyces tendae]
MTAGASSRSPEHAVSNRPPRTEAVTADAVRTGGEKKWFMADSLVDGTTAARAEVPTGGTPATWTFVRYERGSAGSPASPPARPYSKYFRLQPLSLVGPGTSARL